MSLKRLKNGIAVLLSVTLMASGIPAVYAQEPIDIGEEQIDETVEELIGDNANLDEDEVYEDLEILESLGMEAEMIQEADVNGNEVVYSYEISEDCIDKISIEETRKGTVMNVTEGDIQNTLLINDKGEMYIDNRIVVFFNRG